jgi:hypothetical protein
MSRPTDMTTLTYILEKLRIRRQDNEFLYKDGGFAAPNGRMYQPEDLRIIKTYRFEGESDPSDASVLYILEANDGLIGYTMDAYGVYSSHEDEHYDDFIRKIPVEDRDEQILFQ